MSSLRIPDFQSGSINNLGNRIPLAHTVYWYGQPGDTSGMTRYVSTDPNVIGDQIEAMQNIGIEGLIALTYGPTVNSFIHKAVTTSAAECAEREGFLFGLCLSPWVTNAAIASAGNSTSAKTAAATAAVIAALKNSDMQSMLNSRGYLPEKYVLSFNTGADLTEVESAIPGITMLELGTGFSWPNFPANITLSSMATQNALPTMKIPGLCPYFNDGLSSNRNVSVWTPTIPNSVRVLEPQAGGLWWDEVATMQPSKYVQLITWNDYFERTALEPWASMLWGRIGK